MAVTRAKTAAKAASGATADFAPQAEGANAFVDSQAVTTALL